MATIRKNFARARPKSDTKSKAAKHVHSMKSRSAISTPAFLDKLIESKVDQAIRLLKDYRKS